MSHFLMSHFVDESDIEKEIMNLNNSTTSQDSDIPVKIIRNNLDIFKHILCQELNRSIELSRFRRSLRQSTDKANYRLIIILPKLSKVLERCLWKSASYSAMRVSKVFQCSTRYYPTKRKMENMFRTRVGVWCFGNWPFERF